MAVEIHCVYAASRLTVSHVMVVTVLRFAGYTQLSAYSNGRSSSSSSSYGRTLSERPCYILPMFFLYFFYGRLSWPNG